MHFENQNKKRSDTELVPAETLKTYVVWQLVRSTAVTYRFKFISNLMKYSTRLLIEQLPLQSLFGGRNQSSLSFHGVPRKRPLMSSWHGCSYFGNRVLDDESKLPWQKSTRCDIRSNMRTSSWISSRSNKVYRPRISIESSDSDMKQNSP